MLSSSFYALLAIAAGTANAQRTTTATILIPDWCVTQAAPSVTIVNQDRDLTTYSYSCSIDSSAVSSASAKASSIAGDARSRASDLRASAENNYKPTDKPNFPYNDNKKKREVDLFGKRDDSCYGWNAFDGCIPWEVTQGPSIWAVHYTVTGIVALDQECSFGPGGVASGPATCTADGRLDPGVWGQGDGPRTHTFVKNDVDRYWIRNTVAVTSGGNGLTPATTRTFANGGTVGTLSGGSAAPGETQAQVAGQGTHSTGLAEQLAIPTGFVAMAAGAGSILMVALAL